MTTHIQTQNRYHTMKSVLKLKILLLISSAPDEITAVLCTRRLRWYGHIQRATSCINSITRLGLPGTRNRGRPRKTWSACVRNDVTICNLDGVNPLDRNSWKTSVRRCQVLPTPESGTTAAP